VKTDRHRFLALAFASADLMIEIDSKGRITLAIGATSGLSRLTDVQLPGHSLGELFAPDETRVIADFIRTLPTGSRRGPMIFRLAATDPSGEPVRASVSAFRLPGMEGSTAVAIARATVAAVMAGSQPARDMETQLLETSAFQDRAAEVMKAAEAAGRPVELTLLDLPDLDRVRARMSGEQAEELNRQLGTILRSAAVDGQTVGRLGPNRFGVVRDQAFDPKEVTERIEALPAQIAPGTGPLGVERQDLALTGSGLDGEDGVRALRYAVNRFANMRPGERPPKSLSEAISTLVQETVERIQKLDSIVQTNKFNIVFQPIVSMTTGVVHHYEVLTRFDDGGPMEMITFAEEIGLIEQLDLAVAHRAIAKLRATPRDVVLAVNVSGKSIENNLFVEVFLKLLEQHKDIAARLEVEITESAELKELDKVEEVLQKIRRLGYIVCLDDFGSGAASFRYLQALSVDVVKIDGAYVKRLGKSRRDDALIEGMVKLCHSLGIDTIAEFVESADQAEKLRKMGVKYGQGWLFGKPSDALGLPSTAATAARPRR
jgi:EAL domain-containing protein (putative c-di-GMP-specific phosphodiesterase class I)/GGDEF domain-containing protein